MFFCHECGIPDNVDWDSTESFLKGLLDPELWGHAVSAEIRNEARHLLGMTEREPV